MANVTDPEAEYNARAMVPGHPAIVAGWARDAALFRASHAAAELDLAYGPTPRQVLDLFWPGQQREVPLALFIHGGYWQALDKNFVSHLAQGLLAHGVAVAVPSYDLCPHATLAEITEQLRAAAAFLHARHGRKLLATGHSAGGHLAAMLLATDWRAHGLPADLVSAALPISGVFDLVPLVSTSMNAAIRLDAAEARRLSPMFLPPPAGRLHAVVGGEEGAGFARQSRGIAAAWHGTWESRPGHNHFTVVGELADPASAIVRKALHLLV
jgi:arylformamidase